MALKNCKECGNPVSSKANKCPSCGAPRKKTSGCAVVIAALFLTTLIGVQLLDSGSSTVSPTTTTESPGANASAILPSHPAHDEIFAMPESERRQNFRDLLQESGKDCTSVIRTFFQGFDSEQAAYWNIECSGGKAYAVAIPKDLTENTRILEREILQMLGIEMFKKFEE